MRDRTHSYLWHLLIHIWIIYMFGMTYSDVNCAVAFKCVRVISYMVHGCDATQWHMRHDSFLCVIGPIYVCESHRTWFVDVTRLIPMCDRTHLYVWHDVFRCELCSCLQICVSHIVHGSWRWRDLMTYETRLIHMCDRTHLCVWVISYMGRACDVILLYVWQDSFICVTFTHLYVWNDSFICVTWRIPMWIVQLPSNMCESYRTYFVYVTWLTDMGDTTHSYVW